MSALLVDVPKGCQVCGAYKVGLIEDKITVLAPLIPVLLYNIMMRAGSNVCTTCSRGARERILTFVLQRDNNVVPQTVIKTCTYESKNRNAPHKCVHIFIKLYYKY